MDAAVFMFAYKLFLWIGLILGVFYPAFMALLWCIAKPLGLYQSGETFWEYMNEI